MKLSEISATLREIRVAPIKSLGQNFLHDQNLARWIVEQAEISADDFVIEIGPGLGALTELALAEGAHVLAIEKDKRLADYLGEKFSGTALKILHADAVDFDTRMLYARAKVKFLGNLPYYIASQLLIKFLEFPSPISLWLLMLQKEFAKRLTATPGTRDYGSLTLTLQFHHRIEYLRSVDANVFLPKPEVDSALVRVIPRAPQETPECDFELFQRLVRLGFSQRRKQLGKLLREYIPDWPAVTRRLGVNERARAQELSFEEWVALVNCAASIKQKTAPNEPEEQFTVVDEYDQPVGLAPRGMVHANNSLHRAVHILIFNKMGDLFLQLRSRSKDRHPLTWDSSAAGHVNAGEDYDETAKRELMEELGAETTLERVSKLPASEKTGYEFIWLYRGTYDGTFKLNRSEIDAGRFFPPKIVDAWIKVRPRDFAPGFVECWKIWRETNS
jgi:16S rRNA (adenine1518-N6/adenine1519-N6)-dimethyltransferase